MESLRTTTSPISSIFIWILNASLKVKLLVFLIIALVLSAIIGIIYFEQRTAYVIDYIKRGTVSKTLDVTGNAISEGQGTVYSTVEGIITTLYVSNGAYVHVGDKLFSVKSIATDAEKALALAGYENAITNENAAEQNKLALQTQLEQARQQIISASSAVDTMNANVGGSKANPATGSPYTQNDKDVINSLLTSAHENFSTIEKKYLQADTAIKAAKSSEQANLLASQQTQDAVITAPSSGIVSNINYSEGDKVLPEITNTTSPTQPAGAIPVLTVGSLSKLLIKVQINEDDIANITLGQQASFTFDAIKNKNFSGSITKIDKVGTDTQGVISYNVYLTIDQSDASIQPGMTAEVTIQLDNHDNVLFAPNTAIKIVNGKTGVFVEAPFPQGKVWVPVQAGIRGDTKTEILNGLTEGTTIITGEQ